MKFFRLIKLINIFYVVFFSLYSLLWNHSMWFDLIWIGKKQMDKSLFEGFLWSVKLCVAEEEKKPIYIIYKEKEKSSVLMQMLTGLFTLCESPEILQGKIGLQFLIFGGNIVLKHYGKIIKIMHGYTLNLKALIKVSKVSFHMKYLP